MQRLVVSRLRRGCLAVAALALLASCAQSAQARRLHREQVQEALTSLESPGLVIGEFGLPARAVVDGDTVKVEGLETSLRLLGIDTEETFKKEEDRRLVEADWSSYMVNKRGDSKRPVKAATPLGEEAKEFAKSFFEGVSRVRLERDHPKDIRGRYNRYLAYVFVELNGRWVNYNIEAVRAGMSPYFTKYGYSRRFHDEFVAAEKEARENQRGIWRPGAQCYPDYDERKTWWDARAEFILEFEREARDRDDFIVLNHWDAIRRIDELMGQEVTILGTVGEIRFGDRGPSRALLSRRLFNDFPVVFFDRDVFLSSGITRYEGEFVRVTGVVNEYQNKYNKKRQLQLLVNLPSQVVGSSVPGLEEESSPPESPPTTDRTQAMSAQ